MRSGTVELWNVKRRASEACRSNAHLASANFKPGVRVKEERTPSEGKGGENAE
jgi:hypothetical protein